MNRIALIVAVLFFSSIHAALADGPRDNNPETVRQVPRVGVELSQTQMNDFEQRMAEFQQLLNQVRVKAKKDARTRELLPDVEIFYRAVRTNIDHRELFSKRDVFSAAVLTNEGRERARQLLAGKSPWTTKTGLVVRGFRSKIDGTVQPYGLVIPESYSPKSAQGYRLDLWFHGRGETLSETSFIRQRMQSRGRVAPRNAFVLHPYGRYSNAFKFAGEIDVLEALGHAKRNYQIDKNRIAVRGFSMGGAGCWQMAVHYPDLFFAANPGAGFSETPEFLKFFQKETLKPTWYEKKLWQWYDCPGYAINLYHCPTVAYSGELDTQKQAADVMEAAFKREGMNMLHLIGPKTKHSIHRDSAKEIERRLAALAVDGRNRHPKQIHFATYTLKYNRMHWVTVNALGEHWKQARVDAEIGPKNHIAVNLKNVTDFTLSFPSGSKLLDLRHPVRLVIDGKSYIGPHPKSDGSFSYRFYARGFGPGNDTPRKPVLAKRHNLQGPIDDAFMDSFIFVKPTRQAAFVAVQKWTQSELAHAIKHWRQQFRGDARVKSADAITKADIANSNLVLFGDPSSNPLIAKIAAKLPIQWDDRQITVGGKTYDALNHALILIYPNPLNPKKYVVFNSGFTYREYAYLNNARQVPMLPDWAVVDLRTPAGTQFPGKVVNADFFGEKWELRSQQR